MRLTANWSKARKLRFETLESRRVLATVTVTNASDVANGDRSSIETLMMNDDGGDGISLREAIEAANNTPNVLGPDQITFNIQQTGGGKVTIKPESPLPAIDDPVVINGYTQPGSSMSGAGIVFDGVLMIELDGSSPNMPPNSYGLTLSGNDSFVTGLMVNRFDGTGIVILGNNNSIAGNIVGSDENDSAGIGNRRTGIWVVGNDNQIGGFLGSNVISGNIFGVDLFGKNNLVDGNLIGVTRNGLLAKPNGIGVILSYQGNRVRDNVISGNSGPGVFVSADENIVSGNFVGTDVNGQAPVPNRVGIRVLDGVDNVIGGLAPSDGNRIWYNRAEGVLISMSATSTQILTNSIYENGALGIDLSTTLESDGDGVTANDVSPDADVEGGNRLQNFPVLEVIGYPFSPTLHGVLESTPFTPYLIQIFDNDRIDPSGHGEGKTFLANTVVFTDGRGKAEFNVVLDKPDQITTTATNLNTNDTSEFSGWVGLPQIRLLFDGEIPEEFYEGLFPLPDSEQSFDLRLQSPKGVSRAEFTITPLPEDWTFDPGPWILPEQSDLDPSDGTLRLEIDPLFPPEDGDAGSFRFTVPEGEPGERISFNIQQSMLWDADGNQIPHATQGIEFVLGDPDQTVPDVRFTAFPSLVSGRDQFADVLVDKVLSSLVITAGHQTLAEVPGPIAPGTHKIFFNTPQFDSNDPVELKAVGFDYANLSGEDTETVPVLARRDLTIVLTNSGVPDANARILLLDEPALQGATPKYEARGITNDNGEVVFPNVPVGVGSVSGRAYGEDSDDNGVFDDPENDVAFTVALPAISVDSGDSAEFDRDNLENVRRAIYEVGEATTFVTAVWTQVANSFSRPTIRSTADVPQDGSIFAELGDGAGTPETFSGLNAWFFRTDQLLENYGKLSDAAGGGLPNRDSFNVLGLPAIAAILPTDGPAPLEARTPVAQAIAPRIDFGLGTEVNPGDGLDLLRSGTAGNPFGGIVSNASGLMGDQDFAARFTGFLNVTTPGLYAFSTRADDGVVLKIDGQAVIRDNDFKGVTIRNATGAIELDAGMHEVELLYWEAGANAGLQLTYTGPDTQSQVAFPGPDVLYDESGAPGGLTGRFYDYSDIFARPGIIGGSQGPLALEPLWPYASAYTTIDRIDFGAGTEINPGTGGVINRGGTSGNMFGGIGVDIGSDEVQMIADGFIEVPEPATYRFWLRSDDGSVLLLDNELVIDSVQFQGTTNRQADVFLEAGSHQITVGYFEGGYDASLQLDWQQLNGANPFPRMNVPPEVLSHDEDDDAIELVTPLVAGAEANVSVAVATRAQTVFLNMWFDANGNKEFDANEHLIVDSAINSGEHQLTFDVPSDSVAGDQQFLFRLDEFPGVESFGYGLGLGDLAVGFWTVEGGPALPGDYNLNGVVDGGDFLKWQQTFGTTVDPFSGADGNGDGVVDGDDLEVWDLNFGSSVSPSVSLITGHLTTAEQAPAVDAAFALLIVDAPVEHEMAVIAADDDPTTTNDYSDRQPVLQTERSTFRNRPRQDYRPVDEQDDDEEVAIDINESLDVAMGRAFRSWKRNDFRNL